MSGRGKKIIKANVKSLIKLNNVNIEDANFYLDCKQATDCILTIGKINIGIRTRKFEDYSQRNYKNEFTIRGKRDNGVETEIDKITKGFCDYNFYSFSNQDQSGFVKYVIYDLDVFRKFYTPGMGNLIPNGDGTYLLAFNFKDFPKEMIIIQYDINLKSLKELQIEERNKVYSEVFRVSERMDLIESKIDFIIKNNSINSLNNLSLSLNGLKETMINGVVNKLEAIDNKIVDFIKNTQYDSEIGIRFPEDPNNIIMLKGKKVEE